MPRRGPRPTAGTTARGYGYRHQQERKRLAPIVDAGNAYCAQPVCLYSNRWIAPGTPWDLGHNDTRTGWIGPTHRECNQLDGAVKSGRVPAWRLGVKVPHRQSRTRAW